MLLTPAQPLFSSAFPLVLDLDGTLIHTDTFHEMMASLLRHKPWILLKLPFWFLKGRAYTKARLIAYVDLSLESLPYNRALLSFARQERKEGRPLILATGTDQRLAQKISDHLGIFQEVIGSNGRVNMTGHQKAQTLIAHFGAHGFDYAGDSPIDEWVWKASRKAIVVCPKWGVLKKARCLKNPEHLYYIPRQKPRGKAFILALRPLFWAFNVLSPSLTLFVGLNLLCSGLLILGDLLTLDMERQGEGNIKSVFATGHLHLATGFLIVPLLIASSIVFLLSSAKLGFSSIAYVPVFMIIDRLTRSSPLFLRWTLLGLFQLLALSLISLS